MIKKMTFEQFSEILSHVVRVTRSEFDKDDLKSYWIELCHLDAERLSKALAKCTKELKRFPTVAQIRERLPAVGTSKAVLANCEIIKQVKQARLTGAPQEEIESILNQNTLTR